MAPQTAGHRCNFGLGPQGPIGPSLYGPIWALALMVVVSFEGLFPRSPAQGYPAQGTPAQGTPRKVPCTRCSAAAGAAAGPQETRQVGYVKLC